MQNLKILNSREVKGIHKLLKEQFGFLEELDFFFLMNTKNKVYIINKDIRNINLDNLRIDSLGLYFGEMYNAEFRLSVEGSQIIGKKATKNILELNNVQISSWVRGFDIEHAGLPVLNDFLIIKHKNDFFGCGKYRNGKVLNYFPKTRRLNVVNE